MAKYYYNGVLLPEIPADVLVKYPYQMIAGKSNYTLIASNERMYRLPNNGDPMTKSPCTAWANYEIDTDTGTWKIQYSYSTNMSSYTSTILWSNHDIPNNSIDSTEIFLYGSDPVPETPPVDRKYLIRSNSTLYTITDGALTALTETEITASLFQAYGVDDLPDGFLLVGLTDPEVLYWQDSEEELPTLTITVKGTPPLPQIFTSEPMDLTHESIAGIDHAAVDASEDVRFAISFDDGGTWKAFDGSAWFEVSDTAPGMLASTMNAITAEQWAEVVQLTAYRLRFWLPNVTAFVKSVVIHYINP